MSGRLAGRTAVITGASRGLGKAMALALAAEEVGQLAVYLCSDDAGFITGTDILIDGGWCAR